MKIYVRCFKQINNFLSKQFFLKKKQQTENQNKVEGKYKNNKEVQKICV